MKPTRQFVICLIAFLSFSFSTTICYASEGVDIPVNKPTDPNPNGQSRAPFRIPLTVSYIADVLSFNFLYPVGSTIITITDESDSVIYLITIDTFTQSDLYIPVDQWNGGIYHISIEYGCNILTAKFEL